MDKELDDWLEQEYQKFESQFLTLGRFWRAPVHTLKETPLYDLFEKFKERFPDHPDDINTVFYLTESVNCIPIQHSVLLWCSHFEHSTLEDLRNLVSFMEEATPVLATTEDCSGVERLNDTGESVVLIFYMPPDNVVGLLKNLGARGGRE